MSLAAWAWYVPNGTSNLTIVGNCVANGFASSSDTRLKDNVQEATTQEAGAILDAVKVKTYTRNDRNDERRVGFIAQDLEKVCKGSNYAHIIGSTVVPKHDADGEVVSEEEFLTVDYSRLVTVLWTCCQDLRARVAVLESKM